MGNAISIDDCIDEVSGHLDPIHAIYTLLLDAADDEIHKTILEEMEEEEDGTDEEGVEPERKNCVPEKRRHLYLEISSMMM
eukprot:6467950-Ditylum_brightwellii.AAC.1